MSFETSLFVGFIGLAWLARLMMRHPKGTAQSASFLWSLFKK